MSFRGLNSIKLKYRLEVSFPKEPKFLMHLVGKQKRMKVFRRISPADQHTNISYIQTTRLGPEKGVDKKN